MQSRNIYLRARFFRLRLWQEPVDAESCEWRGEIIDIQSGRARAFRTPAQLVAGLRVLLYTEPGEPSSPDSPARAESPEEF